MNRTKVQDCQPARGRRTGFEENEESRRHNAIKLPRPAGGIRVGETQVPICIRVNRRGRRPIGRTQIRADQNAERQRRITGAEKLNCTIAENQRAI